MKIALFDTRVGNLHSLAKALEHGGARVLIEPDPGALLEADAMVIPGVGAFGAAAERMAPAAPALRSALTDGYPCLGICLGMQLLFGESDEGPGQGLGVVPGRIRRLRATRVPHMGWNTVEPEYRKTKSDPLFTGVVEPTVYFANSFIADPSDSDDVIAWTDYEDTRFPAAVRRHRTWGVQFHPEKSARAGLRLIRNFLAEAAR